MYTHCSEAADVASLRHKAHYRKTHDIIQKPEVHNVLQCDHIRRTKTRP